MPETNVSTPAQPTSAARDPKTTAILAWLFAPISSFLFKNESDEFVKSHVRESFYFGVLNVAIVVVLFILNICVDAVFSALLWNGGIGLSALIGCLWSLVWLAVSVLLLVPRVIGIVKANNGEKWTVPYGVSEQIAKYIKF